MKEFIGRILLQYGKDRGVWVAVATFLSHFLSRKIGLDLDASMLTDIIAAVVTWGITHALHIQTVEKRAEKGIEVPEIGNKENKE